MTAQQSQPAADPMYLAAEEAVVTRLQQWATGHYDDITIGAKRAALVAVDSAAPIIRDAARAQAFREAADMVANCKPETNNPDFRRALEAFQTAIAAGLRISANLTQSDAKSQL